MTFLLKQQKEDVDSAVINHGPYHLAPKFAQSATSALETCVVSRGQETRNADTLLQLLYLINR